MTVRIKDVCGIVVFVITQPQSRLAVVSATSIKCGPVKSVNGRASLCCKCDMESASNGTTATDIELRWLTEAETRSLSTVFAVDLNQGLYAKRREDSHIECPTQCEVLYGKINVIQY